MDARFSVARRVIRGLGGLAIAAGLLATPDAASAGVVRVRAVSASRVRVPPVYETRARLVTIPALYETRLRRVWHQPVYEYRRVYEAVAGPVVVRRTASHSSRGRVVGYRRVRTPIRPIGKVWGTKRVLVRGGYYETVYERVCVRPATTRTVYEKVLVTPAHWAPVRGGSGYIRVVSTRRIVPAPRGGVRVALCLGR